MYNPALKNPLAVKVCTL